MRHFSGGSTAIASRYIFCAGLTNDRGVLIHVHLYYVVKNAMRLDALKILNEALRKVKGYREL